MRAESAIDSMRDRCRACRYTTPTTSTKSNAITPSTSSTTKVPIAALMKGMSAT